MVKTKRLGFNPQDVVGGPLVSSINIHKDQYLRCFALHLKLTPFTLPLINPARQL
jgi:hypothetical protein